MSVWDCKGLWGQVVSSAHGARRRGQGGEGILGPMRQGRRRSCNLTREKGLQMGLEEGVELARKS